MNRGEVWFAKFPYEDEPDKFKYRPVIILDNGNIEELKVLVVKVTTKERKEDVPIIYWQEAKLRFKSFARTAKFLLLPQEDFKFKIGDLHPDDLSLIETSFIEYFLNSDLNK
ncbi:MAG: type II toxin-antitoxin system PemK/MazF family toxin [Fusobacterium sp.]